MHSPLERPSERRALGPRAAIIALSESPEGSGNKGQNSHQDCMSPAFLVFVTIIVLSYSDGIDYVAGHDGALKKDKGAFRVGFYRCASSVARTVIY